MSTDETIEMLKKLRQSADICYACEDNPMCKECVLDEAIRHLRSYENDKQIYAYDIARRIMEERESDND